MSKLLKANFLAGLLIAFMLIPLAVKSQDNTMGIQGQWRSSCMVADFWGETRQDDYVGSGNTVIQTSRYFADPNCTNPIITIDWQMQQTVGAEVRSGVRNLDLVTTKAEATALSEVGKTVLEAWGYCGYQEWPVATKRDVTERGGNDHCIVKLPYASYTIYSILGDRLYFGGFTPDPTRRSGELNMGSYLTKVTQ